MPRRSGMRERPAVSPPVAHACSPVRCSGHCLRCLPSACGPAAWGVMTWSFSANSSKT